MVLTLKLLQIFIKPLPLILNCLGRILICIMNLIKIKLIHLKTLQEKF